VRTAKEINGNHQPLQMAEFYLESKREIQPSASLSLRSSSPVSLSPIVMEIQLEKIKFFSTTSFLQERLGF